MRTATRATSTCWAIASATVVGAVAQAQRHGHNGFVHHRLNGVKRVVLWGNPMRQQDIRFDDDYLAIAKPDTAGILGDRLEGPGAHAVPDPRLRPRRHVCLRWTNDMAEDERAICKNLHGQHRVLRPVQHPGADLRTGDAAGSRNHGDVQRHHGRRVVFPRRHQGARLRHRQGDSSCARRCSNCLVNRTIGGGQGVGRICDKL